MIIKNEKINYIFNKDEALKNNAIIPLDRWLLEDRKILFNLGVGVYLQNDEQIDEITGDKNNIPVIVIDFSNFDDGSSYSKVRILRSIHKYNKKIIAANAHIDQLQAILRCGVNLLSLSSEYTNINISQYININSICYQDAYNNSGLVERF